MFSLVCVILSTGRGRRVSPVQVLPGEGGYVCSGPAGGYILSMSSMWGDMFCPDPGQGEGLPHPGLAWENGMSCPVRALGVLPVQILPGEGVSFSKSCLERPGDPNFPFPWLGLV